MKRGSDNSEKCPSGKRIQRCPGVPFPQIINLRSRLAIEIGLVPLTSFGLKTNIEILYQSESSHLRGEAFNSTFFPSPLPLSPLLEESRTMVVPNTFVSSLLRVVLIKSPCVHILGGGTRPFPAASSPPLLLLALQVQWSTVHQPNTQDLSIFGKGQSLRLSTQYLLCARSTVPILPELPSCRQLFPAGDTAFNDRNFSQS